MAITSTPATGLKTTCNSCGSKLEFLETDLKLNTGDTKCPGLFGEKIQYVVCPKCGKPVVVRSEKGGAVCPTIEFKY